MNVVRYDIDKALNSAKESNTGFFVKYSDYKELLERARRLDDDVSEAMEIIGQQDKKITDMRNCGNCDNQSECLDGWKGFKCDDMTKLPHWKFGEKEEKDVNDC